MPFDGTFIEFSDKDVLFKRTICLVENVLMKIGDIISNSIQILKAENYLMYVKDKHQGHQIAYLDSKKYWQNQRFCCFKVNLVHRKQIHLLHITVLIISATPHINCIVVSLAISWHVSLSGHDDVALLERLRQ